VRNLIGVLMIACLLASGCGYHVAGKADLLPDDLHTIAIPAFYNNTTRLKLTQSLPRAIGREFISRTRYRIVADREDADAYLHGGVINYLSYPTIFDAETGRAAAIQMIVVLDVRLYDNKTGRLLYQNPHFSIQNRYEISTDQVAYFEESNTALERLSGDVARTVVSAVLENF
jgi:hypothetical protein